ncbi:putative signal transducing protein [Sediminicola sp. 1XM1-17]|uniref:putative signal transducing protein n=1 Tax=Sediminicola sp. 1XM1-17 TaxID=3127702 RepID=UPI003077B798
MESKNKYVSVFTGSEVDVILLKGLLEDQGIGALVKNEQESARVSGFGGGSYSGVRLYILESDKIRANPIIESFLEG